MEISGDLEAFRAQLLAEAATKKRRRQDHATQHQQALECKRLRNASPMSPKLVQDVFDLVIAAAVPESFEIKILRLPGGKVSLMDGSQHGQVLVLERLVALMSLNRACHTSVLREVGKKLGIRIKVWEAVAEDQVEMPSWENTLDSMLAKTQSQHSILSHAATIEEQDLRLWDWSRDVITPYEQMARNVPPIVFNQGRHESFANRYLRRYTATFHRQDRSDVASYNLANIDCERWSLSQPLPDHGNVASVFQQSAWALERKLKAQTGDQRQNGDRPHAALQEIVQAALSSSWWNRRRDFRERFPPGRQTVVLRPKPATRLLFERFEAYGDWEEDEMWKELGI